MTASPNGLLLLNKAAGVTSFDSLWHVKKALHTRKAGHTGTLDKFATGLLVVLVGRALRLSPWFSGCGKRYEAVVRFGEETDTLDPEGQVIAAAAPPSLQALQSVLPVFSGDILQAPPEYSAIHVGGKRASQLAREGKTPEMQKRPVTVHSLELVSYDPPFAALNVHCSSGTYIRSLARDIALACGSRARLETLKRTSVGGFMLEDINHEPHKPHELDVRPITADVFARIGVPCHEVNSHDVLKIIHGKPLDEVLNETLGMVTRERHPRVTFPNETFGTSPRVTSSRAAASPRETVPSPGEAMSSPDEIMSSPDEAVSSSDEIMSSSGLSRGSDSLALFHGGSFLAMAVRSPDSGAWKYGFVYALSGTAPEAAQ